MKVSQLAAFLNETAVPEFLGKDENGNPVVIIKEDLSNFLDFGRAFTDTATNEDLDNFIKKLADKVGKQIFVSREYKPLMPDIVKDGSEWGSVVEKSRIVPRDFETNFVWDLTAGEKYDEFLTFKPNNAIVKYYNKKVTYRIPLEITRKQVKGSMTSADAFTRFAGALEQTVANQMSLAYEIMAQRLVNGMICQSVLDNRHVKLGTLYTAETGKTFDTIEKMLADADFLRWSIAKIKDISNLITKMSTSYNDGTAMTFTPKEYQKLTMLSPYATALETNLYSGTYHDDFLKLGEYDTIPFWQNLGTGSYADRAEIKAIPIHYRETAGDTDVDATGVIAVLRDVDALAIFNHEKYTTTFVNPDTAVTRYNHFEDLSLYADTSENFVVFTLG